MFKVVLSSLSVSTVSVPLVNVAKVTTTPIHQYKNPDSKHAITHNPVFSISHVNSAPAAVVVTLNFSLPLYFFDILVTENLLCHVCKVFPPIPFSANLTTTSRSHALIKKFPHFLQQLMIAPRKSAFCDYNYEYKGVSLQASFSMFIISFFHVILNFQSAKMDLVFKIFSIFNLTTLTYMNTTLI